jgi:hypothetical protein
MKANAGICKIKKASHCPSGSGALAAMGRLLLATNKKIHDELFVDTC